MPERKRRPLWKTALKALAAAAAAVALLVLCGFILASPQVRHSRFGKEMERRLPVRWSQVALVFGKEEERSAALSALARTGSLRAAPIIVRATRDRSAAVSAEAVGWLGFIAPGASQAATLGLVSACDDRRIGVRAEAYQHLGAIYADRGLELGPDAQAAVARGLRDPDTGCQWEALTAAFQLYEAGEAVPQLRQALQDRLLSPPAVPPAGSLARPTFRMLRGLSHPQALWVPAPARRGAATYRAAEVEQLSTVLFLWVRDTPESRAVLREYLSKHPLTEERRPGQ